MTPERTARRSPDLLRLADTILQPGFVGTTPPDWLRRRLGQGLGGVALFARNIVDARQVAALVTALRAENPDVIVAVDEEAGDVTRFEARTGSSRPGNLALGAVDDLALTEQVAHGVGVDLAAAGVTLDYAPDADLAANPDNPATGVRSFGADPALVARHTAAWVCGLQSAGVAACAKHFPGHGDTAVDSHTGLPTVTGSAEEIAATALVPFRAAVEAGVRAVMSAHLLIPAYDAGLPATLSPRVMHDLLRTELGFAGLAVTDGIEMRAVCDRYGLAGAAVRAVAAGADAVCVGGGHADEATATLLRDALVDAVTAGTLAEDRLVAAAGRVRELAAWTARAAGGAGGAGGAAGRATGSRAVPVGLAAARRALRVRYRRGATLPLAAPPHVVEFTPDLTLAIGPETPWGLAAPLAGLVPGTTSVRLTEPEAADLRASALTPATGRPLVLVVRDAHRHRWVRAALAALLGERPDAVVVEMGLPVGDGPACAVHVATFGATRVCGQAAAELLAGR